MRSAFSRLVVALCLLAITVVGSAGTETSGSTVSSAATYKVTPLYSNVSFSIMKFFFQEEGGFGAYSGTIFYDPVHPERSHVAMTVQAASIDTRNSNRDASLRSDDFFDVEKYPTLSFMSTSVARRGKDELEVTGDLTIRGVTKQITIPVKFLGAKQVPAWGDFVGFDTVFTIDRTAFGVNGSKWSGGNLVLSKEVTIHLAIGAIKDSPSANRRVGIAGDLLHYLHVRTTNRIRGVGEGSAPFSLLSSTLYLTSVVNCGLISFLSASRTTDAPRSDRLWIENWRSRKQFSAFYRAA
jgi:polyisoprenoid-binding protein YceI